MTIINFLAEGWIAIIEFFGWDNAPINVQEEEEQPGLPKIIDKEEKQAIQKYESIPVIVEYNEPIVSNTVVEKIVGVGLIAIGSYTLLRNTRFINGKQK